MIAIIAGFSITVLIVLLAIFDYSKEDETR